MTPLPPHLLIRADASAAIGTGHVMRMIALAQAWRRRGGAARFLCCLCPDGVRARVEEAGFEMEMIDAKPGSATDLQALLAAVAHTPDARVALDNYHFDLAYQKAVKAACARLLVVDDYGHLPEYSAHVLLNQNPSADSLNLAARTPGAMVLAGTKFALLREEFLDARPDPKPVRESPLNVLVTLGGSDPDNVTLKVVEALRPLAPYIAGLRVLVGAANPHKETLRTALSQAAFPWELLDNVRNMPEQLTWADAAVTAGGSTCWELAFMGVPMAVVVVAENQAAIAEALHKKCGVINLGWHSGLSAALIQERIEPLFRNHAARATLAARLATLVDGHGADRAAASLETRFRITFATAPDSWINDLLAPFIAELRGAGHRVEMVHRTSDIPRSDITFALSFEALLKRAERFRSSHNLVAHASALPHGRGWSPLTWQILEGKNDIPLTLFEAADGVDSGEIYLSTTVHLEGHELINESRAPLAQAIFGLCRRFVAEYPAIASASKPQRGQATSYRRRTAEDSRLHPDKTLASQFDLLRVVDNERYPAFFDFRGHRFILKIYKASESCSTKKT